jgi:Zn ribbon nucleic-acid-binding protein
MGPDHNWAVILEKGRHWKRALSPFLSRKHLKAGATCETCHGAVQELDVMSRLVDHNMKTCMACHETNDAPNECGTCHEENF